MHPPALRDPVRSADRRDRVRVVAEVGGGEDGTLRRVRTRKAPERCLQRMDDVAGALDRRFLLVAIRAGSEGGGRASGAGGAMISAFDALASAAVRSAT